MDDKLKEIQEIIKSRLENSLLNVNLSLDNLGKNNSKKESSGLGAYVKNYLGQAESLMTLVKKLAGKGLIGAEITHSYELKYNNLITKYEQIKGMDKKRNRRAI